VGVLNQGCLVESGSTHEVFAHPKNNYTEQLVNSQPVRELLPLVPLAPVLLKVNDLSVSYPQSNFSGAGLRITKWFTKAKRNMVLQPVSFQLKQGQTIGVIGESGSGKTTLAMAVLGLLGETTAHLAGDVEVLDQSWQTLSPLARRAMRANLQVIFQDPFGSLSPRMTIFEIVAEGLNIHQPKLSCRT
jgi:microcin C transport system ATP-binding protein